MKRSLKFLPALAGLVAVFAFAAGPIEPNGPVTIIRGGGASADTCTGPNCAIGAGGITTDGGVIANHFLFTDGGELVGNTITFSTAPVNLFVDPTGSNTNACTSAGASACLTIQGALNKSPKHLYHQLTVSVAAGSYTGFYVSGFTCDISQQRTNGGIFVNGTLANSTLASGTATGTATAVSVGSGSTFGTMTDGAQTWTVNDLRGRFLTLLTGTGAGTIFTISSNTATVATVVGNQAFNGGIGTTYAIQDSATLISTGIASPATPVAGSAANNAGAWVADNTCTYAGGGGVVTLQNLRFTNVSANGVVSRGAHTQLGLNQIQFAAGSATTNRILGSDGAVLTLSNISSMTASTTVNHVTFAAAAGSNNIVGAILQNGARGVIFIGGGGPNNVAQSVETINTQVVPIEVRRGSITTIQQVRLACAAVAGNAAVRLGSQSSGTTNSVEYAAAAAEIANTDVSGCDFAVAGRGATNVDFSAALTGTAVTSVFDIRFGAQFVFEVAPTVTGAVNEISLDNAASTATFASIPATGNCLTSLTSTSRACRN